MAAKSMLEMPEFLKSFSAVFISGVSTLKDERSTAVLMELICVSMSPMYCRIIGHKGFLIQFFYSISFSLIFK